MRSGEAEANNDLLVNITAFASAVALVVLSYFPNVLFRAAAQVLLKLL
jgi:hypothetical protein